MELKCFSDAATDPCHGHPAIPCPSVKFEDAWDAILEHHLALPGKVKSGNDVFWKWFSMDGMVHPHVLQGSAQDAIQGHHSVLVGTGKSGNEVLRK